MILYTIDNKDNVSVFVYMLFFYFEFDSAELGSECLFLSLKEGQCHGHLMGYNSSLTFPKYH